MGFYDAILLIFEVLCLVMRKPESEHPEEEEKKVNIGGGNIKKKRNNDLA